MYLQPKLFPTNHIARQCLVLLKKPSTVFLISAVVVNAGNYIFNLWLGRVLGPTVFAEAAIMVTLLLVLSFVGMTLQTYVAKFTVELPTEKLKDFIQKSYGIALLIGIFTAVLVFVFAPVLARFFAVASPVTFYIFALGIPPYFILSVYRGKYQGEQHFVGLAKTYQLEMLSRFLVTACLLYLDFASAGLVVSIGIVASIIVALFPGERAMLKPKFKWLKAKPNRAMLWFFGVMCIYECTQILCNNSDILLVKHYFDSQHAGLYASLALIGRIVFFVTWMLVMLLLPQVIKAKKEHKNTNKILQKYLGYIGALAGGIVIGCFCFPTLAVTLLFGPAYVAIANLLGWYALATALFALANVFTYYFLSLEHYFPVLIAVCCAIFQIVLITYFHSSLFVVVMVQCIAMGLLLLTQLGYYFRMLNRTKSAIGLQ